MENNSDIEVQNEKHSSKGTRSKKPLTKAFSYQWIIPNLGFFLFLTFLAVLYIANGHMADKTIRDINRTQQELRNLQYEYKTAKSELMFRTEEDQVLQAVAPSGLQISTEEPLRLHLEKR